MCHLMFIEKSGTALLTLVEVEIPVSNSMIFDRPLKMKCYNIFRLVQRLKKTKQLHLCVFECGQYLGGSSKGQPLHGMT